MSENSQDVDKTIVDLMFTLSLLKKILTIFNAINWMLFISSLSMIAYKFDALAFFQEYLHGR